MRMGKSYRNNKENKLFVSEALSDKFICSRDGWMGNIVSVTI